MTTAASVRFVLAIDIVLVAAGALGAGLVDRLESPPASCVPAERGLPPSAGTGLTVFIGVDVERSGDRRATAARYPLASIGWGQRGVTRVCHLPPLRRVESPSSGYGRDSGPVSAERAHRLH
jgi:hypothetical protein